MKTKQIITIAVVVLGLTGVGCEYYPAADQNSRSEKTTIAGTIESDAIKNLENQIRELKDQQATPQVAQSSDELRALQDKLSQLEKLLEELKSPPLVDVTPGPTEGEDPDPINPGNNDGDGDQDEGNNEGGGGGNGNTGGDDHAGDGDGSGDTGEDPAPETYLIVASTTPANGATGVVPRDHVIVKFGEAVDGSTVTKDSLRIDCRIPATGPQPYPWGSVIVDQAIQKNPTDFIFKLRSDLPAPRECRARVMIGGIRSVSGHVMNGSYEWLFGTIVSESGGDGPKGGEETREETPDPVVRKVVGLKLHYRIGDLADMGTDNSGRILFSVGPNEDLNGAGAFRAWFNDDGALVINRNSDETIDFGTHPESQILSGKKVSDLTEADLKYFRIASDPDHPVVDGFYIRSIELLAKFEGEAEFVKVYRNPCVFRWIEKEGNRNLYSIHSIEHDDAFCTTIETADQNLASTDNPISLRIPLSSSLTQSAKGWIDSYAPSRDSITMGYNSSAVTMALKFADYNDFQRGQSRMYGATIYDGRHRMSESFRISIDGADAWLPSVIHVRHIRPGDPAFLQNGTCMRRYLHGSAVDWISTEAADQGDSDHLDGGLVGRNDCGSLW